MGAVDHEKLRNRRFEGRERKRYFSLFYTTLMLFERMCRTREGLSVRKIMKFRGIHVQRRDRVHKSLELLLDLGWIRAVLGSPVLYEVTEKGMEACQEVKRILEFHDCIMFGKWESRNRPWDSGPFFNRRR